MSLSIPMTSPMSTPQRKAYRVISGLLSGPDLSYDEFTKGFILRHLVDLVSTGLVLQYKIDNVASVNLLQAYGSIPYQNKKHSVPVTICFPQYYPHLCPEVFVNCADDTTIQESNCVDSSGAVSHAYLDSWKYHESNVVSLFKELTKEFTDHPPLCIPNLNGVLTPDQITQKYLLRHYDLATYLKNKEGGLEAFIKNVKDVASAQEPTYSDATKRVIQEHIRNLHRYYPEKGSVECDLSKPLIQVLVKTPYCQEGCSKNWASVTIYLPVSYPASRAHVWLDCPNDHVIKKDLVSIAPTSGLVFFTYLRNWDEKKSNLVGLVSHLSAEFTCQPPFDRCQQF
ncbi:unnamed protein product [Arabis nemorensis]|uniref:UEV domain-containing protein n=1 Tax=Arabis nemorensis TaxID=586526 RepID=A0A565B0X4_9BRAS|nr:unnamed protein product [Arabis nemorensis]